ncbi:MAG: conjugal transfer protein, partial [Corynebacterium durum]
MGRINPRDAGRRPMDPQTLIMAILLGVVVTAAFTVQLSLWAAVKLGAAEMDLSINPFETLLYLATGRLPWPPVAT